MAFRKSFTSSHSGAWRKAYDRAKASRGTPRDATRAAVTGNATTPGQGKVPPVSERAKA